MPLAGHFGCEMVRHAQGLVRCGRICMRASGPGPSVVSANKCKARRRRQRDSEAQSSLMNTCTTASGCAPACCLCPLRGCVVLLQDVTVMAHAAPGQHMCACAAVSVCCVVCLCMCARACQCACEFFVPRVPSHFVTVSLWCDIGVIS